MASLVGGTTVLVMVVVTGSATMLRVQVPFVMIAAAEAWTTIGISGNERLGHFSMLEWSSGCTIKPITPLD
jgi:hypothetical protein